MSIWHELAPGAGLTSDLSGTARVRIRGRRPEALHVEGGITLEPSRLGADTLEEGTIDASLDRGDLTVRTRLLWPAGRLTLAGSARPFDSIPTYAVREGVFQGLDLGKLLRRPSLRTALSGSLRLEGSGREAKSARLDGTITVDSSIVNRTVIRGGRLQLALADGRVRLVGGLRGDGDSITVDGTAEPFATPRRVHLTSQIGIADLAALLGRDTIDAGGAARIVVEGELGRPEVTRLRGTRRGNGHFAGISVDSLRADGRLAAGLLDLDTLAIRSNVAHLAGGGRVALYGPDTTARSAFRLGGSILDLAPLGPVLGIEGLAVDSGRVDLRLDGPKAAPISTPTCRRPTSPLALGEPGRCTRRSTAASRPIGRSPRGPAAS